MTRGQNDPSDGNGHGTHVAGTIAAGNGGDNAANHTPARVNGTNIYTASR